MGEYANQNGTKGPWNSRGLLSFRENLEAAPYRIAVTECEDYYDATTKTNHKKALIVIRHTSLGLAYDDTRGGGIFNHMYVIPGVGLNDLEFKGNDVMLGDVNLAEIQFKKGLIYGKEWGKDENGNPVNKNRNKPLDLQPLKLKDIKKKKDPTIDIFTPEELTDILKEYYSTTNEEKKLELSRILRYQIYEENNSIKVQNIILKELIDNNKSLDWNSGVLKLFSLTPNNKLYDEYESILNSFVKYYKNMDTYKKDNFTNNEEFTDARKNWEAEKIYKLQSAKNIDFVSETVNIELDNCSMIKKINDKYGKKVVENYDEKKVTDLIDIRNQISKMSMKNENTNTNTRR